MLLNRLYQRIMNILAILAIFLFLIFAVLAASIWLLYKLYFVTITAVIYRDIIRLLTSYGPSFMAIIVTIQHDINNLLISYRRQFMDFIDEAHNLLISYRCQFMDFIDEAKHEFNKLMICAFLTFGACASEMLSHNISHISGLFFAGGLTYMLSMSSCLNLSNELFMFIFLNMIIYGGIGLHLQSTLICSVCVMFCICLLIRIQISHNFIVARQNKDTQMILSVILASGLVTTIGLFLKIFSANVGIIKLFVPGMLSFGTFIFLTSMLLFFVISKGYFYKLRSD